MSDRGLPGVGSGITVSASEGASRVSTCVNEASWRLGYMNVTVYIQRCLKDKKTGERYTRQTTQREDCPKPKNLEG